MNRRPSLLLNRAFWTIGSYAVSISLRLGTNVVVSRLLAPELLGIMVIVNSIKTGVELLTDVGIEQNIVSSPSGLNPKFLNTAWTIQVIRGACLCLLMLALSIPLSGFYQVDAVIFVLMAFAPFLNSLHSTSIFVLVKQLEVRKRNLFELGAETIASTLNVLLALLNPTIWAPLFGVLGGISARSTLSHLLRRGMPRFTIDKSSAKEIFRFGKWITMSSFVVYTASNLDRIYLGKAVDLGILGVFGLARTIADLAPALSSRLSYQVLFPALSAMRAERGNSVGPGFRSLRRKFVFSASVCLSFAIAWADMAVTSLYDPRYHDASWMLCVLLVGSWFGVLSNLNEATLLGLGKPAYNTISNTIKLGVIAVGIPIGLVYLGLLGAILAIVMGELFRLFFIVMIQESIGEGFARQDAGATTLLIALLIGWVLLRTEIGLQGPLNAALLWQRS
ncbi:hypothetical protein C7U92_20370 [Bradyrhizobium sp. WBOS7]|uniref:Oligosaccharide flippase family protein n=1 Tax=Bradyrhizobium betae TaxID=244734 RepID=A0AAE9SSL6_9BRAD|nr:MULTISPECIES: oligosaccharide flippase family protein [Bradyrhizobium]MDD1572976.1 hypothetical protein [Bradyrhizobium sp. WBOS1]UUO33165.1 hypothetical protein DCK84_00265 [Bradyrhizobium sp. WBOS01]MDD1529417.1 hypothetical protein [Bradyrhizobium sp. WBOS2]MDD1579051.1 hypothetical protein [Bradyrhizobium sp. WBOS7]MDD1601858.1 hypothetical protein [Bradyrhizobium sp. WBOS16]